MMGRHGTLSECKVATEVIRWSFQHQYAEQVERRENAGRRLLQQSRQDDDGERGEQKWKNGIEVRST